MSNSEELYTETLQCLAGYPGAQQYAKLCCKLPNFYYHAAKHELAYEALAELAHKFAITSNRTLSAPELMWHIAKAWQADSRRATFRKSMDKYLQSVATQLLIVVTDEYRQLPH